MNKEEIEDMFETLTEQWGDSDNLVNDLLSYSKKLEQENKQLKEIIDNAIKYMKEPVYRGYLLASMGTHYFKLLEILKGE